MIEITYPEPSGAELKVAGQAGESAMQCAARRSVPGIIGECGGAMACATCHAYVDEAWLAKLPAPSELELEMLDGCLDRRPNSRLTCQIVLAGDLDGLGLSVPESQI